MAIDFDPLTGSPLPTYFTEASAPPGPVTGDSGYDYGGKVLDLLKFGVKTVVENRRSAPAAAAAPATQEQYQIGRQGLTQVGQPAAPMIGGVTLTPTLLILGVLVVGGVLFLVARK